MRLFVFAIGGTGSRVLTSLVFQLAAGAKFKDSDGNDIKNLSIVPIIVDPHATNAGLNQLNKLLRYYREIHKKIYQGRAENENARNGFFATRIESLKEAYQGEKNITDTFFYNMRTVSDKSFSEYIDRHSLEEQDKCMVDMLFSKSELLKSMGEGFYGSPNKGCVALNEFVKSQDFNIFKQAFSYDKEPQNCDKIFVIGSIHGGTGAAGLPLIVSSIRNLYSPKNRDITGNDAVAMAPIGVLAVMPYFKVAFNKDSDINENDWIPKIKSALKYYDTSLNRFINRIYYISDPQGTSAFENDSGRNEQKGNKAHVVEYIGATAMFDFLQKNNDNLGVEDKDGIIVAKDSRGSVFGFTKNANQITFKVMPDRTNALLMKPMMKFYLLRHFMSNNLKGYIGSRATFADELKLQESICNERELEDFFAEYDRYLKDVCAHGNSAHNLDLFSSPNGNDFSSCFKGFSCKKKLKMIKYSFDADDIKNALNHVVDDYKNGETPEMRWFITVNHALEKLINERIDTTV